MTETPGSVHSRVHFPHRGGAIIAPPTYPGVAPGRRTTTMTDLRSLKTLLAVAEYGSIHLAAQSIFISHSTASRQIRNLEEHYGTQLFERTTSGVIPTAQGLAVADFARRTIAESE